MLSMLAALDLHDGQRVLEIGTGTGYHAALLAARLGDDAVTTIELDPTLAQQARSNLSAAGDQRQRRRSGTARCLAMAYSHVVLRLGAVSNITSNVVR